MASYFPAIHSWYRDLESGQHFEVVAIDENSMTIEVQYDDGDIGEYDTEAWKTLSITKVDAPGEVYSVSHNDYGSFDTEIRDDFFINGNPLELIEPETYTGFDDLFD